MHQHHVLGSWRHDDLAVHNSLLDDRGVERITADQEELKLNQSINQSIKSPLHSVLISKAMSLNLATDRKLTPQD